MKLWGQLIGLLALLVFLLPALTAQEEKKKDADKTEAKKDDAKKDPEKKEPEKKDPDKKGEKKAEKKSEAKKDVEKVEFGARLDPAKLVRIADNSAREFAVEVREFDPERAFQVKQWYVQQSIEISREQNPVSRIQRMNQLQIQLQQKQQREIYTMKPKDFRAADNVKVRTLTPPLQYDDQGNLKKWSQKELAAARSKTLPGFAAELDSLRVGQYVQLYLAKAAPMSTAKTPRPKRKVEDDDLPTPEVRPEVVMIVVIQDVAPK